jgi:hypothetical protein
MKRTNKKAYRIIVLTRYLLNTVRAKSFQKGNISNISVGIYIIGGQSALANIARYCFKVFYDVRNRFDLWHGNARL